MVTTTHEIRLVEVRPGRWRAECSCEQYKSSGYSYRPGAVSAGEQHVRAKAGAR